MAYVPADAAILDLIELRLGNITTVNEYNNQFKRIVRAQLTPFKGFDLPACNYYHTTVDVDRAVFRKDEKSMALVVEAHTKTRDDPFIDLADSLAADIVTGLFRDPLAPKVSDIANEALGGAVQRLKFTGHDPFIGQGQEPFCGTLVRFEVTYLTEVGNMITFT